MLKAYTCKHFFEIYSFVVIFHVMHKLVGLHLVVLGGKTKATLALKLVDLNFGRITLSKLSSNQRVILHLKHIQKERRVFIVF